MSRAYRISRARANRSASIQRRLPAGTLPRAKLQKSHVALQEFVTATLQSAGPPRGISLAMSHAFATLVFTESPDRVRMNSEGLAAYSGLCVLTMRMPSNGAHLILMVL